MTVFIQNNCFAYIYIFAEISTFCITNNQDKALKSNAKQFRDIKNNEYICFSSKALNNINSIKRKIIDMYLK